MKKTITAMLCACLLSAVGCKKKDDNPTPTPTASYYFKFKFDGNSYNFNADLPQYMPFYTDEAGGYQMATNVTGPSVGFRLDWQSIDTVSEANLMAVKGKTLYFNDSLIRMELTYSESSAATNWTSIDTANTSYNVKITDITFLKKDTSAGIPLKTYVIKGTCNGIMERGSEKKAFSDGDFNFIISRRDF